MTLRVDPAATSAGLLVPVATNIGQGVGGGTPSYSITVPAAIPAKSLIAVVVLDDGGVGAVTDSAKNKYTIGFGQNVTWMYYCWNCAPLSKGNTINYIKADSGNASLATAFFATGILDTTDPRDLAVEVFTTGDLLSKPVVNSKGASSAGELFVSFIAWTTGGNVGITQDSNWAFPPNSIASFNAQIAGGNVVNPGTDPLTYSPTIVKGIVGQYVSGITAFKAKPKPIIVPPPIILPPPPGSGGGTDTPTAPDEGQNPTYPDDRFMTDAEVAAAARACSLIRAISPGERICNIDTFELAGGDPHQNPAPHELFHSYADYMLWRYNHVIGPGDPWTPWLTYDEWAAIAPVPPPPAPTPNPPVGWMPRVRLVTNGISQLNGYVFDFLGYSFATKTRYVPVTVPSLWIGGSATRVTLASLCTLLEVYIAIANSIDPDDWLARPDTMYQLTFGGKPQVDLTDLYNGVTSDPLPFGLDGSTGFIVSGFVSARIPGFTYACLSTRDAEDGWQARFALGNIAAQLDKSDTTVWLSQAPSNPSYASPVASLALMVVEGYYPIETAS